MLFDDSYKMIDKTAEGSFSDRGSKFLAYIYPVSNEIELKELLNKLKKEHPKATHHCYAYRLGYDKSLFRVNDDGEPAGTAGKPIYNLILSNDLTNILIVVIRYYGGTMLGIPGLINAYKSAANDALSKVKIETKKVKDIYTLEFPYQLMNTVMSAVKLYQMEIMEQSSAEFCSITLAINRSSLNEALEALKDPVIHKKFILTK